MNTPADNQRLAKLRREQLYFTALILAGALLAAGVAVLFAI